MEAVEHSRLIYLTDALRSSPEKAEMLFQMTTKRGSDCYLGYLKRLERMSSRKKDLLKEVEKVRAELR